MEKFVAVVKNVEVFIDNNFSFLAVSVVVYKGLIPTFDIIT